MLRNGFDLEGLVRAFYHCIIKDSLGAVEKRVIAKRLSRSFLTIEFSISVLDFQSSEFVIFVPIFPLTESSISGLSVL